MEQTSDTTLDISFTDPAISQVQKLIEEQDAADHALRIFVSGGGCSGMQYGMALDPQLQEGDLRATFNGFSVVVDANSISYLQGATIDYHEDLMSGGFRIDNPNAISSCGCGQSFRTERRQARRAKRTCGCH
jgi:iron-sulfur cluster assembly protein